MTEWKQMNLNKNVFQTKRYLIKKTPVIFLLQKTNLSQQIWGKTFIYISFQHIKEPYLNIRTKFLNIKLAE